MWLGLFGAPAVAADPTRPALERARQHPHDPAALLRAAQESWRAGDPGVANELLERVLWLGDLDPPSSEAAAALLSDRSPKWRGRQRVRIHVYADESVRAAPEWKPRLRNLVLETSRALADVLDVRFTLASIAAFESEGVAPDLDSIHRAFTRATAGATAPGILLAVTGRPIARDDVAAKQGIAEFLGRRVSLRLQPGTDSRWTLAHEILHLYGAIHVGYEVTSLMNPTGDATRVDRENLRCVRAMQRRVFDSGAVEPDVMARIDLSEAVEAYEALLESSRTLRRIEAGRVVARDESLADAARVIGGILLSDGRSERARTLFEAAEQLYGPETRRGRETAVLANALRGHGTAQERR